MPLFNRTELQTTAPYAVPSSDALRQQALERGWQRSRRVAQRRLAWRWAGWALTRFGLPVVLVLTLSVSLLELIDSAVYYLLPPVSNVAASPPTAQAPSLPRLPVTKAVPSPAVATTPVAVSTAGAGQVPAALRLSSQLRPADAMPTANTPSAKVDPIANPTLQLTPILQRKEPS